jgi:hypothetical protein
MLNPFVSEKVSRIEVPVSNSQVYGDPVNQIGGEAKFDGVESGFGPEPTFFSGRYKVDIAGASQKIPSNVVAVGPRRGAGVNENTVPICLRQPEAARLSLQGRDRNGTGRRRGRPEMHDSSKVWRNMLKIWRFPRDFQCGTSLNACRRIDRKD